MSSNIPPSSSKGASCTIREEAPGPRTMLFVAEVGTVTVQGHPERTDSGDDRGSCAHDFLPSAYQMFGLREEHPASVSVSGSIDG